MRLEKGEKFGRDCEDIGKNLNEISRVLRILLSISENFLMMSFEKKKKSCSGQERKKLKENGKEVNFQRKKLFEALNHKLIALNSD